MSNVDRASLIVKLEGDGTIDVNTLINMLTHYVTISERANEIVGEGAYKSDIKVKALYKGSFEISFEIVTKWLDILFNRENVSYASSIVSCVAGIFTLYKVYKGKKVSEEDAKKVINNTTINNTTIKIEKIINVYNDHATREAIRKSFETAKNDENVTGITLISNGEMSPTITEDEFGELVIPPDDPMPEDRKIIDEHAVLNIISLSFNKGDDWKFVYNGNPIKTKLSDDGLQAAIDKGMSFAKGDALNVALEIVQKWDDDFGTYVNKRYKVLKVNKHIKGAQQQQLFK